MDFVSAVSLLLSLVGSSLSFQPATRHVKVARLGPLQSDYLSYLSQAGVNGNTATLEPPPAAPPVSAPVAASVVQGDGKPSFFHSPLSDFTLDKLVSKGPRANPDVGQPADASKLLTDLGIFRSGSWSCTEGGWASSNLRTTTEIFYVFSGHGCLTDIDGMKHHFGPGDTVILPKGWSGRWDIFEQIHKVWFVHNHPHIEETADPIRITVKHYNSFAPQYLTEQGVRADAIHGSQPSPACDTIYDVGQTKVGVWTCTPGSFPLTTHTTGFHVLEGVFFLTNEDGSARRCEAGDTVVLPEGWKGQFDIIETVKKLWVVVKEPGVDGDFV